MKQLLCLTILNAEGCIPHCALCIVLQWSFCTCVSYVATCKDCVGTGMRSDTGSDMGKLMMVVLLLYTLCLRDIHMVWKCVGCRYSICGVVDRAVPGMCDSLWL